MQHTIRIGFFCNSNFQYHKSKALAYFNLLLLFSHQHNYSMRT